MRPPMPMNDYHRSMPTSAYDMDPRDPRVMNSSFDSCRMGMEGPDYFGAMGMGPAMGLMGGPFTNRPHSRGPYPPGFDQEMMTMGGYQIDVDERVRRNNLFVQLVNGQISYAAKYGQMQPKMCTDGRFPPDFRTARTVEEVKVMDPTALDRILRAYGLPTDLRSLRLTSRDSVSTKTAHHAKLCTLFDFLGAMQISERERMKRGAIMPY